MITQKHDTLVVTKDLSREPFKVLFLTQMDGAILNTLQDKASFLQNIINILEILEENSENQTTRLHWVSTFTGFFSAATIAGISVLNPLIGVFVAGASAASAIATIGLTFSQNQKTAPILEKLKRHKIALKSDSVLNWATVWQLSDSVEFFCSSVMRNATQGLLNGQQLLRSDGKTAMTAAVDCIASTHGMTRDAVVQHLKEIKAGHTPKLPTVPTEQAPTRLLPPLGQDTVLQPQATVLQPDTPVDFRGNALSVLQSLVNRASDSVLGGCVILAAPGAGKTTFLGAAWGRVKEKYGSNFKSLAVVVKKSDVKAFQGVSDECLCVKDSPRHAALAIIKFIDESMQPSNQVRRLFLDDFLTMQKYFENISSIFINPSTYKFYLDRKEALKEGDLDACLFTKLLNTRLNELWLVGRQYNAALYVSSHSSNVEALPFIGSREARAVGDLIFLAKTDKREFIEQALNNTNLIGDSTKRAAIKFQLDTHDATNDEPLLLGNFNNWTLGIVPNSVHEEYLKYRAIWESTPSKEAQTLEAMFNAPAYEGAETLDVEPPTESNSDETVDNVAKVLSWLIDKRPNGWVKFKGKHDRDMNFINFISDMGVKAEGRDSILNELVKLEKIELSPDGDYFRLI
jgi:hypothetical protein